MFFHGTHSDLIDSIEAIGAAFAVFEFTHENNTFNLISCNSQYEEIVGKNRSAVMNLALKAIFPRYISKPLIEAFRKSNVEQIALETEIFIDYKAEERYWRSIISPVIKLVDQKVRIIHTCVEITEKKRLEKQLDLSLRRFEAVVQTAYDGIITIDESQNVKLFNDAAEQIFGYSSGEIVGNPLTKLIPHKFRKNHVTYVDGFKNSRVDSRPMQTRASVRGLRKDGSEFPIEVTISKIHVAGNIEMTAVIRDISEKNKLLEELLIASREDPLTKLFNRRHFSSLLYTEMARLRRFKRGFTLLMADIDHFKVINDSFGHECGDQALVFFKNILQDQLRATDMICRWGGEEFLILLPETDLDAGLGVAEKIRKTTECTHFDFGARKVSFTISIGVQFIDDETILPDRIIDNVDKCLYRAKENGRNCVSSTPG